MPRCIRIRRFRVSDLDRIMAIENCSFPDEAYSREMFLDLHRHCGELFLAACRGAEIHGYMVTCVAKGKAEIISIAVDPKYQRTGVGAALMEATLAKAGRSGIAEAWLMVRESNTAARRFYERFGFSRVRRVRGYYEDGADGLRMRKYL